MRLQLALDFNKGTSRQAGEKGKASLPSVTHKLLKKASAEWMTTAGDPLSRSSRASCTDTRSRFRCRSDFIEKTGVEETTVT